MSANPDIELLRIFHAILHFGRFLVTAGHLNYSPSAVSTHVRRPEELADGRLFERDNRSVRPAPLGQWFQRQTAELLETHDRVLVGSCRREEPLRVHSGISEEYADKLLGRLLPRLGAELPALELEVFIDVSGGLAGRLRRGQLDLTLLVQAQDRAPYDGYSREIDGTQPVWVTDHGLRIDPRRPLSLTLHGQGCPYQQALLRALGVTGRRRCIAVNGPGAAALEAVIEGGLAIGVIDRVQVDPMMRVLGPAEGFAELPAHCIRLVFAPGERPPMPECLGKLIVEELRL